jgi:RimJ/RimL family protein N-acetyltransferase
MNFPQEISTERLLLRPPQESDALAVFERYAQDERVCKYLTWRPHQLLDETREYLQRVVREHSDGAGVGYMIFARESGLLLGSIRGTITGHRVQFGYCIASDSWGHGFATEASRAFVEAVMREPEIWRIEACCDLENRASARVLTKSGLAVEGTLRRYMFLPNRSDVPRDVELYARVRE